MESRKKRERAASGQSGLANSSRASIDVPAGVEIKAVGGVPQLGVSFELDLDGGTFHAARSIVSHLASPSPKMMDEWLQTSRLLL